MLRCEICGYIQTDTDDYNLTCPLCMAKQWEDYYIIELKKMNSDQAFINAMMKLKESDPIEFQIKLNQLGLKSTSATLDASKNLCEDIKESRVVTQPDNHESEQRIYGVPMCPTCGSYNVEKISLTKKAVGGAMFGLFSSNVRKTMHCKNCGYKW